MNMVVWVTVGLLVICGVWGWRTGVVQRLLELIGLVASILLSARFASAVAPWLADHSAMDTSTALLASYVLVFVAALILVRLAARGLAALVRWTPLGWLDRLGGAVCTMLIAALLISIGLIAVSQSAPGHGVRDTYLRHPVGQVIYYAAPSLYQGARRLFGGQIDDLWHRAVEVGGKIVDDSKTPADNGS
ncbi:MAG: CvpA family protein [Candidatus Krumholzibacteria bacterium]|jgi:uncharacterized membrane protein required for colicin V production|nr:CvpA family protein [Candidatus Krumholzibacteria bacterium]